MNLLSWTMQINESSNGYMEVICYQLGYPIPSGRKISGLTILIICVTNNDPEIKIYCVWPQYGCVVISWINVPPPGRTWGFVLKCMCLSTHKSRKILLYSINEINGKCIGVRYIERATKSGHFCWIQSFPMRLPVAAYTFHHNGWFPTDATYLICAA